MNITLRKLNTLGKILLVAVLFSSCSESDLVEISKGNITDGSFWKNESEALMGLRGAYAKAGDGFSNYGLWQYVIDDAGTDITAGGYNAMNSYVEYSDWSATRPDFNSWGIWPHMWQLIYNANRVLTRVPSIEMPQVSKDRILGEAYGLRAFGYFTMLNWFGPMAEVTDENDTRTSIPRGTKESNYALMESDLLAAIEKLPSKSALIAMGEKEYGRLSKGAVQSLLVKCYIEMGEWQKAADLAKTIEDSNEYGLYDNYLDIFAFANEGFVNKEVIWPLVFSTPQTTGQSQVFMAIIFKSSSKPEYSKAPNWGSLGISNSFYNSFAVADERRQGVFKSGNSNMIVKYPADPNQDTSRNGNDFPFIRFADIILMRAEALNNMDDLDGAVAEVNKIRLRANLTLLDAANFTKETMNTQILNERRWEFYLEGQIKRDMRRMDRNRLLDYIKSVSKDWQTKGAERYLYLPIPNSALFSNPALLDNPWYIN